MVKKNWIKIGKKLKNKAESWKVEKKIEKKVEIFFEKKLKKVS